MSMFPPVFTEFPSRSGPTNRSGMNAPSFVPDMRDERLERAGYLLVVYTDGLVRAVAALVLRICRSTIKQIVTLRQTGARPSASKTRA